MVTSDINQMTLKELYDLKVILVNLRDDYFNELSGYDSRYLLDEKNLTPHLRQIIEKKKNVDSVIISFSEKNDKLDLIDFKFFEKLVRDSFQYKRKNIRNNLKKYDLKVVESVLNKYGYDLNVRAEALDVNIFIELANELMK
jgi:hypothetical protein